MLLTDKIEQIHWQRNTLKIMTKSLTFEVNAKEVKNRIKELFIDRVQEYQSDEWA